MLRTYHPLQKSFEVAYLVSTVQAYTKLGEVQPTTIYENTHIYFCKEPKEAITEALKAAKEGEYTYTAEDQNKYEVTLLGISKVVPIHEKVENGAELDWLDLSGIAAADLQERVLGRTVDEAMCALDKVTDETPFPVFLRHPETLNGEES